MVCSWLRLGLGGSLDWGLEVLVMGGRLGAGVGDIGLRSIFFPTSQSGKYYFSPIFPLSFHL